MEIHDRESSPALALPKHSPRVGTRPHRLFRGPRPRRAPGPQPL